MPKPPTTNIPWPLATHPDRHQTCPVRTALRVLGGKWKLLIISYLLPQARRYGELRRLLPEISEKMLVQELRGLEADGLATRTVLPGATPGVAYALTARGRRVRPVFEALLGWGVAYLKDENGGPLPPGAAETGR